MDLIESIKNCDALPQESRDDLVTRLERIKGKCGDWEESSERLIPSKLLRAFDWSETEEGEDFWEDWYLRLIEIGV